MAIADPIVIILYNLFNIILNPLTYQQLVVLIIFLSFPLVNSKIKIIASIPLIISIFHFENDILFILYICLGLQLLLIYYLMKNFYQEIKIQGKGSIYLFLLTCMALLDGFKSFIYIENIVLFSSLVITFLVINIIILILLSIFGSNTKIKIPLYFLKWFDDNAYENNPVLSNSVNHTLYQSIGRKNKYFLTERECELLELIARGLTSKEIAHELSLSKRTIDHHREAIKQKLGFSDAKKVVNFFEKLKLNNSNNQLI
jgi:DNA-binding CsgD family transcriptional regulator